MEHIVLYIFLLITIGALLGSGSYLTIVSREDQSKYNVPPWVKSHIKVFKWLGPVLISIGTLLAVGTIYYIYNVNRKKTGVSGVSGVSGVQEEQGSNISSNKFGFKFY